ncbi:MAG TPA: hypothetical protein VE465_13920 [Streptosporangiaceae bacterium]|jgi:hypothetical protein|nr:hypothetical protein [Streptosporangiaceae bacterium]
MARLLNRQRRLAEHGRLRFGVYTGSRPKAILTWIVTSHNEDHVRAAAQMWGGEVERWKPQGNGAEQWRAITEANSIDAVLPPGDPLNEAYEMWSRGGCQRRCDGVTEKLSGSPCLCRAEFGEQYYEQDEDVCAERSRLNLILWDMPVGVWRMETGSYWATDELAAMVDLIRYAMGDQVPVPVRIHLEQRTRIKAGQTTHFVVPVMYPRGVTTGQVLTGAATPAAIGAGNGNGGRAAIEAPAPTEQPAPLRTDFVAAIRQAPTREKVVELWEQAKNDGAPNGPEIEAAAKARVAELHTQQKESDDATPAATWIKAALACRTLDDLTAALARAQYAGFATDLTNEDDEVVAAFKGRRASLEGPPQPDPGAHLAEDAAALWQQIVAEAGAAGFDRTPDLEAAFARRWQGDTPAQASPSQMKAFLDELRSGRIKPPGAAKPEKQPEPAAASAGPVLDKPPF